MGGAGRKPVVGTYLTRRVPYREVSAIDANIDAFEAIIDTRIDEDDRSVTSGASSLLALFVLLGGPSAATLDIYARATSEDEAAAGSSSSSSSGSIGTWAFYERITVDTRNLLHVMWPLPAGEYKVMVTSITGDGEVTIREAHSA